jgi:hypothetical protein
MINLKRVSKTIKKRRKKKKRKRKSQHRDQQNVPHAHHHADHRSDKRPRPVVDRVEVANDQISHSMEKQVQHPQDPELLSSPIERLVLGVLRPKPALGVIHRIIELHRLNRGMEGVCRLLQEIRVRSGNFRPGEKVVLALPNNHHININIIAHLAD